jgi:hypothetical protein
MEIVRITPTSVSFRLRDKLGDEASEDLGDAFEETKNDMLAIAQDRFEMRLSMVASELRQGMAKMDAGLRQNMAKMDANLRVSMADGFASIRKEISEMRVELIRTSFLIRLGQFVTILAVLGYMLRGVAR